MIRTKHLSVRAHDLPEIPNSRTRRHLKQSEEDIKAGRSISFNSIAEARAYINSLIEHDRQSAK